jgi:hypothetical protein
MHVLACSGCTFYNASLWNPTNQFLMKNRRYKSFVNLTLHSSNDTQYLCDIQRETDRSSRSLVQLCPESLQTVSSTSRLRSTSSLQRSARHRIRDSHLRLKSIQYGVTSVPISTFSGIIISAIMKRDEGPIALATFFASSLQTGI